MRKKIKFESYELKIIVESLNLMREKLIFEEMYTDAVDELMFKFLAVLNKIK